MCIGLVGFRFGFRSCVDFRLSAWTFYGFIGVESHVIGDSPDFNIYLRESIFSTHHSFAYAGRCRYRSGKHSGSHSRDAGFVLGRVRVSKQAIFFLAPLNE